MDTVGNNAFPQSERNISIDSLSREGNANGDNIGSNTAVPELLAGQAPQDDAPDTSLFEESEVPTSTNSPASTPRVSSKRRKRIAGGKPKRVRTGCLTCRERHLKCDETSHRCQNCRKSGRICRRGVRLNFIDTQIVAPPHCIPRPPGASVTFRDESRVIASEYVGGDERYPPPGMEPPLELALPSEYPSLMSPPIPLSSIDGMPSLFGNTQVSLPDQSGNFNGHALSTDYSGLPDQSASYAPFKSAKVGTLGSNDRVDFKSLHDPEDILLLRSFVEEVGPWMDSMDAIKHFSQILPFHALEEPMLLKAFMACGARHVYLVNPAYGEEKATYFHDIASRDLLHSLQDPDRDSALCATTAVLLNVYELMSSLSIQDMNHIAGARALIKECHWDARSPGLGGACFWLNVGMELLICMRYNWALAWDPDTWGVKLTMDPAEPSIAGNEEIWTHRMVYICAKVANFRSSVSHSGALNSPPNNFEEEWNTYNDWCDQWRDAVPRSMRPLGYLHPSGYPWQPRSRPQFPEIWLIKQSAIVARLFWHVTRLMLARIRLSQSGYSFEMQQLQEVHAHNICGIVAHVKDRSIAGLSIQFLAVAAECLVTKEAQEEAIKILDRIVKETGWPAEHIRNDLRQAWGWQIPHQQEVPFASTDTVLLLDGQYPLHTSDTADLRCPPGAINPIMASADFSMENHPYREYYVAPHHPIHDFSYDMF
ncbi:hypothetical protein CNMCM5793_005411 [Aspergillus hiratsukae]|uniref:Zn(2)-C6 fungal-type domain-containing protein n=1 Tax=Aspergillus hiratsukae TaxID=1194566 RepID=A0A8H6PLX5_9EURO|nr:hypothetical protein CNMCM5793_005411 [Aspergillus hiratsukae]KAF7156842.1 hypothetical protein CNMCM6106_001513 [Aspergillus hiratsukae]